MVEDSPGDIRLTQEAFKQARVTNDLHVVRDGTEALDFLCRRGDYGDAPSPDIILLGLNLPGMDGTELLEEIKGSPELQLIPVIVLTSSQAEEDIVKSYANQANAYLTKPVDGDEFVQLVRSIGEFWIKMVELPPTDRQHE